MPRCARLPPRPRHDLTDRLVAVRRQPFTRSFGGVLATQLVWAPLVATQESVAVVATNNAAPRARRNAVNGCLVTLEACAKVLGPAGAGIVYASSIARFHFAGHFVMFGVISACSLVYGVGAWALPADVEDAYDERAGRARPSDTTAADEAEQHAGNADRADAAEAPRAPRSASPNPNLTQMTRIRSSAAEDSAARAEEHGEGARAVEGDDDALLLGVAAQRDARPCAPPAISKRAHAHPCAHPRQ